MKSPEDDKVWKRDDKADAISLSLIKDEELLKEKMESLVWKLLFYQHDEMKWQKSSDSKEKKKDSQKHEEIKHDS